MLQGSDIEQIAKKMYKWLKPGGKVFIIAGTPYQKTWIKFIPQYEKNKKLGVKFPGEIDNVSYWNKEMADKLPSFVHLLDIDILERVFLESGFIVEKAGYIDRGNKTLDNIMDDKKESCGLVLKKSI